MRLLNTAATAALFACFSTMANATTLTVTNFTETYGTNPSQTVNGVPRYADPAGFAKSETFSGPVALNQKDGFEWVSPGLNGNCTLEFQGGGGLIVNHSPQNWYFQFMDLCANDVAFTRTDGAKFNLSQVDAGANSGTKVTPSTPNPVTDGKTYFYEYLNSDSDILYHDIQPYADTFRASGLDENSPEGKALLSQLATAYLAEKEAFIDWRAQSEALPDNYKITGYRDGVEVASTSFTETDGNGISLTGFDDIDTVVFGTRTDIDPSYMFDFVSDDGFYGETVIPPGTNWCPYNCGSMYIYGFDYTLSGLDNITAVPVPAALPMMLGVLGLFGVIGRRKT